MTCVTFCKPPTPSGGDVICERLPQQKNNGPYAVRRSEASERSLSKRPKQWRNANPAMQEAAQKGGRYIALANLKMTLC